MPDHLDLRDLREAFQVRAKEGWRDQGIDPFLGYIEGREGIADSPGRPLLEDQPFFQDQTLVPIRPSIPSLGDLPKDSSRRSISSRSSSP